MQFTTHHSPPPYSKELPTSTKGRAPSAHKVPRRQILSRAKAESYSTQQGEGQAPNIMNAHNFTEQHLIPSSDICASDTETSMTGIYQTGLVSGIAHAASDSSNRIHLYTQKNPSQHPV